MSLLLDREMESKADSRAALQAEQAGNSSVLLHPTKAHKNDKEARLWVIPSVKKKTIKMEQVEIS